MKLKSIIPAKTPNYVLLDGPTRIGPKLLPSQEWPEASAVYGFSDKEPYDRFMANSDRPLRPYPLVTGYLGEPGQQVDQTLRLVVIDANGPDDKCLRATSLSAVREAQQSRQPHLTETYRLLFDETLQAYAMESDS